MEVTHPEVVEKTSEFIESNMGLVGSCCNKYMSWINRQPMIEYNDIFSVGCMGLLRAIDKFDPSLGYQFSTYAVPMIHGEIRRFKRDYNPTVKVGRGVSELTYFIFKNDLYKESAESISEKSGKPLSVVKLTLEYISSRSAISRSMDEVIHDDGSEPLTIGDTLAMEVDYHSHLVLDDFLNTLTRKHHRQVAELSLKGMIQREIAAILGITQVQVSRIQKMVEAQAYAYGGNVRMLEEIGKRGNKGDDNTGDLEKAKELLETTNMKVPEIAKITGCKKPTLYMYSTRIRGKKAHDAMTEVAATKDIPEHRAEESKPKKEVPPKSQPKPKPNPKQDEGLVTRKMTKEERIKYGMSILEEEGALPNMTQPSGVEQDTTPSVSEPIQTAVIGEDAVPDPPVSKPIAILIPDLTPIPNSEKSTKDKGSIIISFNLDMGGQEVFVDEVYEKVSNALTAIKKMGIEKVSFDMNIK